MTSPQRSAPATIRPAGSGRVPARRRPGRIGLGVRALLVAVAAVGPIVVGQAAAAPAVGAQAPTAQPPLEAGGSSIGVVQIDDVKGLGWVAADGVVITSDVVADEVGATATFARRDSARKYDCYVARRRPKRALAVLRCPELEGAHLSVATGFPAPGTGGTVTYLATDTATIATTVLTSVLTNDVQFGGVARPRYSFPPAPAGTEADLAKVLHGAPVIGTDGKVLGTALVSPVAGGSVLGTTPEELNKEIREAKKLPASYSSAAVLAVAKRSLIPVGLGVVVGIAWALAARSGTILGKILGMAAAGLVLTVGYSMLVALAIGPEALLGTAGT